jgi:hypothetical protein
MLSPLERQERDEVRQRGLGRPQVARAQWSSPGGDSFLGTVAPRGAPARHLDALEANASRLSALPGCRSG